MKIAICDDSGRDCLIIEKCCEAAGYSDISVFRSGNELLAWPHLDTLNLIFLDIEMKGVSGIEVMHQLEILCPFTLIVFCTSHNDLMSDAFGRNVISFISKPCQEISITNSIQKAECLSVEFTPIRINDTISLPCNRILYLTSKQKYTAFIDMDGNPSLSRCSLVHWCDKLSPYGFSPISRSHAINLKHYRGINQKKVLLSNGTQLDISRRYLSVLKDSHDAYMLRMARSVSLC